MGTIDTLPYTLLRTGHLLPCILAGALRYAYLRTVGGSYAFGDPATGLSVCVLKSAYTPILASNSSVCPTVVEIIEAIRVGLENEIE